MDLLPLAKPLVLLASLHAVQARAQWTPVFPTAGPIRDLHAYEGNLHVASQFEGPPGEAGYVSGVYNGTDLTFPPNDFPVGSVHVFATHNGELIAGGDFQRDPGPVGVGVWDGATWTGTQYNVDAQNTIGALCSHSGDLYVGTELLEDPQDLLVHDGTGYIPFGTDLFGPLMDLAVYDGSLYAGGYFGNGVGSLSGLVRWSGSAWENAGPALMGGGVYDLEPYDGWLYAGGAFTNIPGSFPQNLLFYLARWNGTTLMSGGGGAFLSGVGALCATPAGLYVATRLTTTAGASMQGIALWDGTAWQFMGNLDPDDAVTAIEPYQGQIYIGVTNWSAPQGQTHQVYRGSGQVGMAELDREGIRIGPVPAIDHIQVLSGPVGSASFRIHDLRGQLVQQGALQGSIGIAGLSPGIYVLELVSDGDVRRARFVKD